MEIWHKKYKENSHIPIEEIKRQRQKHAKDLIQPRIEGELNPEFMRAYGAKNVKISEYDIRQTEKKSISMGRKLAEAYKKQKRQ